MRGFDKEDQDYTNTPIKEINTTPLVDLMLVLLVVFLVAASMLTQAIKLNLPNDVAETITEENILTISISQQGIYYWNNKATDMTHLAKRFSVEAKNGTTRPVYIEADAKTTYEKISKVLALLQQYGFYNVGLVTQPTNTN